MGFDVYGEKPKAVAGEYFRNNVWSWRPLWAFVGKVCKGVLTQEDIAEGHWNDGHWISDRKAKAIAARLAELLDSGYVSRYEKRYKERLKKLPLEKCDLCEGTGKRNDERVKGKCNGCQGTGKMEPWQKSYPFSEENVSEFAEFCKQSGGFRIH